MTSPLSTSQGYREITCSQKEVRRGACHIFEVHLGYGLALEVTFDLH